MFLFVGTVQAQTWTVNEDGTGGNCSSISSNWPECWFAFDNTDNSDSPDFISSVVFNICFDPDTGAAGATGDAEIFVRMCNVGSTTGYTRANVCERITIDTDGDGTLDKVTLNGDAGGAVAQRHCIYGIEPGTIYIEVDTAPGVGEDALVRAEASTVSDQ